MTDRELIEGLLCRDRKAFEFLVGHYQHQVIRTASHLLGDLREAEDLSQEIFLEIIRSIGKFGGRSSLSTWIYRITVNRSVTRLRQRQRNPLFMRIFPMFDNSWPASSPLRETPVNHAEPMEEEERRTLLYKAIGLLPEKQRIAFSLHQLDELSYREIADVMGVSIASVESLLFRARVNLRDRLIHHFTEYAKPTQHGMQRE